MQHWFNLSTFFIKILVKYGLVFLHYLFLHSIFETKNSIFRLTITWLCTTINHLQMLNFFKPLNSIRINPKYFQEISCFVFLHSILIWYQLKPSSSCIQGLNYSQHSRVIKYKIWCSDHMQSSFQTNSKNRVWSLWKGEIRFQIPWCHGLKNDIRPT